MAVDEERKARPEPIRSLRHGNVSEGSPSQHPHLEQGPRSDPEARDRRGTPVPDANRESAAQVRVRTSTGGLRPSQRQRSLSTPRTKVDSSLPKYFAIRETGIAPTARPRYAAISRAREKTLCRLPLARSSNRTPRPTATAATTLSSVSFLTRGGTLASRSSRSANTSSPLIAWA